MHTHTNYRDYFPPIPELWIVLNIISIKEKERGREREKGAEFPFCLISELYRLGPTSMLYPCAVICYVGHMIKSGDILQFVSVR